jgi:hypothetical protein
MYDWLLKYGENQRCQMKSGYEFVSEKDARKNGEKFVESANKNFIHYRNPKIEVIKL